MTRAAAPHCDSRVLHQKGECRYCDEYPDWQEAREAWGINFTGKADPNLQPCPSERARTLETIERWPGNRPAPVGGGPLEQPGTTAISKKGLVDDRSELDTTLLPNGQQKNYMVLPQEEIAKGFVRPVRTTYRHVGRPGPKFPLQDLTDEQRCRFVHKEDPEPYVKFEPYPEGHHGSATGRFWTQRDIDAIDKGCGAVTTMAQKIAETYARNPLYYGGTFCASCGVHLPVGADGEFVWEPDGSRVGT
jgi:hypothetical protein